MKVVPIDLAYGVLDFTLGSKEAASEAALTLKHPNNTKQYMIFKIKATHPRSYSVRPSTGIIAPGGEAHISIILTKGEKELLLQAYSRLGLDGRVYSKDKFMVQFRSVSRSFLCRLHGASNRGVAHAFARIWNNSKPREYDSSDIFEVDHIVER